MYNDEKAQSEEDKMKKALVIIDMQNDFISGALGSPEAAAIVPAVVAKIEENKRAGAEIILTRDTHTEDYLKTEEGRNLPVTHCVRGSHGWELDERVALAAGDAVVFDKPSFGSPELAEYLKSGGFDEIELVGLVSSICVISNALIIKAFLPEARLCVDSACTAGVTDEDYKASLCVMKMCHVEVL